MPREVILQSSIAKCPESILIDIEVTGNPVAPKAAGFFFENLKNHSCFRQSWPINGVRLTKSL
jgi:hypothetical protein